MATFCPFTVLLFPYIIQAKSASHLPTPEIAQLSLKRVPSFTKLPKLPFEIDHYESISIRTLPCKMLW